MGLINTIKTITANPAVKPVMTVGFTAWQAKSAITGYKQRTSEGENADSALLKEVGLFAADVSLGGFAGLAFSLGLPAAQMVAATGYNMYKEGSRLHYDFRNPFSQKFEHSDVTSALQTRGLQAIHGSWGHRYMGAEAAAFAKRYGR